MLLSATVSFVLMGTSLCLQAQLSQPPSWSRSQQDPTATESIKPQITRARRPRIGGGVIPRGFTSALSFGGEYLTGAAHPPSSAPNQ